jgi:hypothetical protein
VPADVDVTEFDIDAALAENDGDDPTNFQPTNFHVIWPERELYEAPKNTWKADVLDLDKNRRKTHLDFPARLDSHSWRQVQPTRIEQDGLRSYERQTKRDLDTPGPGTYSPIIVSASVNLAHTTLRPKPTMPVGEFVITTTPAPGSYTPRMTAVEPDVRSCLFGGASKKMQLSSQRMLKTENGGGPGAYDADRPRAHIPGVDMDRRATTNADENRMVKHPTPGPVGRTSALVTFIRVLCTLRTQSLRSICNSTHCRASTHRTTRWAANHAWHVCQSLLALPLLTNTHSLFIPSFLSFSYTLQGQYTPKDTLGGNTSGVCFSPARSEAASLSSRRSNGPGTYTLPPLPSRQHRFSSSPRFAGDASASVHFLQIANTKQIMSRESGGREKDKRFNYISKANLKQYSAKSREERQREQQSKRTLRLKQAEDRRQAQLTQHKTKMDQIVNKKQYRELELERKFEAQRHTKFVMGWLFNIANVSRVVALSDAVMDGRQVRSITFTCCLYSPLLFVLSITLAFVNHFTCLFFPHVQPRLLLSIILLAFSFRMSNHACFCQSFYSPLVPNTHSPSSLIFLYFTLQALYSWVLKKQAAMVILHHSRWCERSCDVYLCSLHSVHADLTINIQLRFYSASLDETLDGAARRRRVASDLSRAPPQCDSSASASQASRRRKTLLLLLLCRAAAHRRGNRAALPLPGHFDSARVSIVRARARRATRVAVSPGRCNHACLCQSLLAFATKR